MRPPGARTAVRLTDASRESVSRGDTLTLSHLGEATETVDVWLERSANTPRRPMKSNALVRVHHGSGNMPARLVLLEGKEIVPGVVFILVLVGKRYSTVRDYGAVHDELKSGGVRGFFYSSDFQTGSPKWLCVD